MGSSRLTVVVNDEVFGGLQEIESFCRAEIGCNHIYIIKATPVADESIKFDIFRNTQRKFDFRF